MAVTTAGLVALAAPSGATVYTNVTTEAGFRTAWTDPAATEIDLGADITLAGGGGCTGVSVRPNTATGAVTLNGNGHTITQACPNNGVLEQDGTGAVTLQNVIITGGTATGDGGGIETSSAPITVTNSTIRGNMAGGDGGGIRESSGNVTVTNSAISGNRATFDGGGIRESSGNVTFVYATVVQNSANTGAQLRGADSVFTSFGSVVALPPVGGFNCDGVGATSNGFNFSDDHSCGFTAGTDKQDAGDPGLGALANNGGPNPTRLPQTGSPLIDAIPLASCQAGITTDERGLARPFGAGCDIGAVEVQGAAAAPASVVVITPKFTG